MHDRRQRGQQERELVNGDIAAFYFFRQLTRQNKDDLFFDPVEEREVFGEESLARGWEAVNANIGAAFKDFALDLVPDAVLAVKFAAEVDYAVGTALLVGAHQPIAIGEPCVVGGGSANLRAALELGEVVDQAQMCG